VRKKQRLLGKQGGAAVMRGCPRSAVGGEIKQRPAVQVGHARVRTQQPRDDGQQR
jgi:hypothetical protein